jgi:hypothetical protein
MHRLRLAFFAVGILGILVFVFTLSQSVKITIPPPEASAPAPVISTPQNATYRIEGRAYTLSDNAFEGEESVTLFGEPVFGDIDGDYDDDAVLLLVYEPGGSGTFIYAAAALQTDDTWRGTNAVLLGDRIAPQGVSIRNRLISANFATRALGNPMTAEPSLGTSVYLTLERGALVQKAASLPKGTQVLQGYITWGGEVRTFRPCGEAQTEHWIVGESPALQAIRETHERIANTGPYIPFFVTIAGEIVPVPKDGFGADHKAAIRVTELVYADRVASCKSDTIVVTSPFTASQVRSPLSVSGYVRGSWAFEGDFPITLADKDGLIIAEGYASVLGEWMTDEYVPFLGTLEFESPSSAAPQTQRGTLILQKDNSSGAPEMEDALEVPIRF